MDSTLTPDKAQLWLHMDTDSSMCVLTDGCDEDGATRHLTRLLLCRRRQTILYQRGGSVEALLLTALSPHLT